MGIFKFFGKKNDEESETLTEMPADDVSADESAASEAAETEASAEKTAEAVTEKTEASAEETAEAVTKKTESAPQQAVDSEGNIRDYYDAFVAEETPKEQLKQVLFDIADVLETVFVTVFVVLLVFTYIFCIATVEGDSMLPTLESKQRLLISRLDKSVQTGDILILDSHSSNTFDEYGDLTEGEGLGKNIVKRLIAQSGQTVNIDFSEGIVYVDDQPLDEPYTSTLTKRDEGAFNFPITIPEGYVFVLGDNRSISKDSRHPQVGLIPEDAIIGTVILRLSPFTVF